MTVINPGKKDSLLTVCLITYNHRPFIQQAIEGILMQKTDFFFDVVIADDCSTDGTAEIVRRYAEENKDKITAIMQSPNVGAGQNFSQLLNVAGGKYIAYFEGDDYWMDENKLQSQVDVLESNPGYVSCFTKVLETFSEDLNDKRNFYHTGCWPKNVVGFDELIYINYIQTSSLVFRNHLVTPLPDWLLRLSVGDWPLSLLLSKYGGSYYINRQTSVHRNHSNGLWSSKTKLKRIESTLEMYNAIEQHTDLCKSKHFKKAKSNTLLSAVKYCLSEKSFLLAVKYFVRGFLLYPKNLFEKKYHF